jgi:hypothetical protein
MAFDMHNTRGRYLIPCEDSTTVLALWLLVSILSICLFIGPIVRRSSILSTMLASIDRPEDRPYTIQWLLIQFVLGYLIIIPLSVVCHMINKPMYVNLPGIVNGFGDG